MIDNSYQKRNKNGINYDLIHLIAVIIYEINVELNQRNKFKRTLKKKMRQLILKLSRILSFFFPISLRFDLMKCRRLIKYEQWG